MKFQPELRNNISSSSIRRAHSKTQHHFPEFRSQIINRFPDHENGFKTLLFEDKIGFGKSSKIIDRLLLLNHTNIYFWIFGELEYGN